MAWEKATAAIGLLLAGAALAGAAPAPRDDLKMDRVVLLMRHGVRPPTKAPPMPAGVTPDRWPDWPVAPGWLTTRGAKAVAELGGNDRRQLAATGVLPSTGCPAPGAIAIFADSDQRTIATADSWAGAFAPGCAVPSTHLPQDQPDPIFSPLDEKLSSLDPAQADRAVQQAIGPGGIAAVEAAQRPLLKRLDAILCGGKAASCGVGHEPSGIEASAPDSRPKLSGALDRASTAAQILLLEYADGKPMDQVGWGRATAADVTALSAFHALEFRLLARPPYIASVNLAGIAPRLLAALTSDAPDAPVVTMFSGHDTNIANLGGLLGVHWHVPGFAADDPAPGGAIMLERLRDGQGNLFVRAVYRAQTLDQIRTLAPLSSGQPYRAVMPIPGCTARGVIGLCTLKAFQAKMGG